MYIYYDDTHQSNLVKQHDIKKYMNLVFSSSPQNAIQMFVPNAFQKNKYHFLPHAVTEEFRIDFNKNPQNKIFLSGAIYPQFYPHRANLINISKQYSNFGKSVAYLKHPGYHNKSPNMIIGKKYANLINKYICGYASSGTHQKNGYNSYYVVSKIFEIAATGALVMVNEEIKEDMKRLGFIDMVNYLCYNKDNLKTKVEFVINLENRNIIDKIRKAGQELIYLKHMAKDRAMYIDNTTTKDIKKRKNKKR